MTTTQQTIVLATRNSHKTDEIRAMLGDGFRVADLSEFPDVAVGEETGDTFEANAEIKAVSVSGALGPDVLVMADDSGLEVDALGGAPGVRSARYAGESSDDAANRAKLLRELEKAGARLPAERTARFRCAIVLARGGQRLGIFDGAVEGSIALCESGAGGFGYDSIFMPAGHKMTFAELPPETKNAMSHRGEAIRLARRILIPASERRGIRGS